MTPSKFVKTLSRVKMEMVFNPYRDHCPLFDRENAAEIRSENLLVLLNATKKIKVHSLWIGRDLGYKGGRRTGIPLTDEIHLPRVSETFGVRLLQATAGPPLSERTATFIWQIVRSIPTPVFFWNIFPFHPFAEGQPLSNRCHTREERETGRQFLIQILEMLQPEQVVAIGRDAEIALNELKLTTLKKVRHPSYGGQSEFIKGMSELYSVPIAGKQTLLDI